MKQYARYFIAWGVNSFLFLLANAYFPTKYVLGNAIVSPVTAAFLNGFLLTFVTLVAKGIIRKFIKERLIRFGYYFLANTLTVWLLARFAGFFGFGIPAFYWAFYFGFISCLFQWFTRQIFKKIHLNEN